MREKAIVRRLRRKMTMIGRLAAGAALVLAVLGGTAMSGGPWTKTRAGVRTAAPTAMPTVTVYKDPGCSCCSAWVERMRAAGFTVQIHDVSDQAARDQIKREQGVTPRLAACHTAIVGGYVVEGHVPPELVKRMLAEHPKIAGLAVPGMPAGSPGMEGMGSDHYDVLAFTADGQTRVYEKK
jgi:hypothetical protein